MHVLLVGLLLNLAALDQSPGPVTGTVLDTSGAPVADATVRLEVSGAVVDESRTKIDGRFEFGEDVTREARIIATSSGFAQAIETLPVGTRTVQITLKPAPFFEAVNVTSTRTEVPRADPTATVTVLPASDLLNSAPLTIDDAL